MNENKKIVLVLHK